MGGPEPLGSDVAGCQTSHLVLVSVLFQPAPAQLSPSIVGEPPSLRGLKLSPVQRAQKSVSTVSPEQLPQQV